MDTECCQNNQNQIVDYRFMGYQFAMEGLDESYLKPCTDEQLREFRLGYDEAMKQMNSRRNDDYMTNNESRLAHK